MPQSVEKLVGFLINPVAGMGGAVGLKGTDDLAEEAKERGAVPVSEMRGRHALAIIRKGLPGLKLSFLTAGGEMGERALRDSGLEFRVVFNPASPSGPEDTRRVANAFLDCSADLIIFCGGDGTARDVITALHEAGMPHTPVLGIPAGVKMHSGVFAVSPQAAAGLALGFLKGDLRARETEIADVDEEMYRSGVLSTRLYGTARTPYAPAMVQERKQIYESPDEETYKEEIAAFASEFMRDGSAYIIGAGTTTSRIAGFMGLEKTLLGVDVIMDGRIILKDASERDLLHIQDELENRGLETRIIVSPIGAQGFILGRGSQQISPAVIRKTSSKGIITVATPHKLQELEHLLVDTGDPDLDREISGSTLVVTGYRKAMRKDVVAASDIAGMR